MSMNDKHSDKPQDRPQRIWVYQQNQNALGKIKAIEQYSPAKNHPCMRP